MPQSPVILIPAYKPSQGLPEVARELLASGRITRLIVVNDGSGPDFQNIFDDLRGIHGVTILRHAVNLGKGAALKTGMNHVACDFPDSAGIVTADADGQHAPADILKVVDALAQNPRSLILGARNFETDVPARSRFGNTMTRWIMRIVTGQNLRDTQTGLRGIPFPLLPDLLRMKTTGYDFELDMLVRCRERSVRIKEVPISTIYIEENRSSHFNPLRDSMRIYFVLVRFVATSIVTSLLDNTVFTIGLAVWPSLFPGTAVSIAACQVAGRLIAGIFQFVTVRRNVFHSQGDLVPALTKYWTLSLITGMISYALITFLRAYSSIAILPAKIVAETILFVASFVIQRDFIFAPRAEVVDPPRTPNR